MVYACIQVRGAPAGRYVSFFFNDTATTEIYTLSLHDALPISDVAIQVHREPAAGGAVDARAGAHVRGRRDVGDRKSTRLNSSHSQISYAVFCLKKKKPSTSVRSHPPHH